MNSEFYTHWGYGRKNDLKLSMEDYYEVIDVLRDEQLSKKMKFKFKNLWEINSYSTLFVPIYAAPFAYGLTKFLTGPIDRALVNWKFNAVVLSFVLPVFCWKLYTMPIPRRLYTEILTDDTLDGDYIRSRIRSNKPGLWKMISNQLNN
jgi:hypothetical protein